MNNEVLDFIKRRWKKDANWLDGNCYWFAKILCERFPFGKIYYLPIQGHFVAKIKDNFYDATGIVSLKEQAYSFEEIKETDPLHYQRLIRDCVN